MPTPTDWPLAATGLWSRLTAHPFEHPQDGLDLTRRLAREQGWTLARARGAVAEYRRFCFLCCVEAEPMTPSVEVDAVWHLHLTYSVDYWERFCPRVLATPLHHHATRGGPAEGRRHREQYARTLAAYERWFGPPPATFWPGTAERFANPARWRQVDLDHWFLLPRPRRPGRRGLLLAAAGTAAALLTGTAAALPLDPLDWTAVPFLWLFIAAALAALAVSSWMRWRGRDTGPGQTEGLDRYELAFLAGGPERATHAGVTDLLAQGLAELEERPCRVRLTRPAQDLPPPLQPLGTAIEYFGNPSTLPRLADQWLERIQAALITRGLLLSVPQTRTLRRRSVLPILAVVALGAAKIAVGLSRDRPVGFLIALTVLLSIIGLNRLFSPHTLTTRAGEDAVVRAKDDHARTIRAPTGEELGLAVALIGTAALSGTAFAAYGQRAPDSDSGGGGGDGGGDGGGGCGGCGGCGGG